MSTVTVTGTYVPPGTGSEAVQGTVSFARKLHSGAWGTLTVVTVTNSAFTTTMNSGEYLVTENIGQTSRAPYVIIIQPTLTTFDVSAGGGNGGGGTAFTPAETLYLTPGAFTYAIPAGATILMVEVLAGGGGGAAGGLHAAAALTGGGGGGGGGRTFKFLTAASARTAYPSGISVTVGAGGTGAIQNVTASSAGLPGGAGGFSFVGDFAVATPGNTYFAAQGGDQPGTGTTGFSGSAGLGDTQGGAGGLGGGLPGYLNGTQTTNYVGGNGGFPELGGGEINGMAGTINYFATTVQIGGGGGGGGGGGIDIPGNPYNGGASGFATTANPTPLTGTAGVVGGATPGTAGTSVIPGMVTQGGGGGGAAGGAGGQAGANAAANSGSGGGGGGSALSGHGGAGGNGGSGFVRITAI